MALTATDEGNYISGEGAGIFTHGQLLAPVTCAKAV